MVFHNIALSQEKNMTNLELPNAFHPVAYPLFVVSTDDETGRYLSASIVGYRTYPGGRIENVVNDNGSNVAMTSYHLGKDPTVKLFSSNERSIEHLERWLGMSRPNEVECVSVQSPRQPFVHRHGGTIDPTTGLGL